MKFRPQRSTLADAMAECVELPPTMTALREHLHKLFQVRPSDSILVKPYFGRDERIGWDTHIVTVENFGVAGFTDAQPD